MTRARKRPAAVLAAGIALPAAGVATPLAAQGADVSSQPHKSREPERERPPGREPWGPRDKATYRTFCVDIRKHKSVQFGIKAIRGRYMEVMKVHKPSPVEEWNRMSARTFPDDVLQAGDIITKICNGDTSLPTTNGIENLLLIVVRRL